MKRTNAVLFALLLIAVGTVAAIVHLQASATASRDAEQRIASLELQLNQLQDIPWQASPMHGGRVEPVRRQFAAARARIEAELGDLSRDGIADAELAQAARPFRATIRPLEQIIGFASGDELPAASEAAGVAWQRNERAAAALRTAGREYRANAERALTRALYGSGAAIALLFGAFGFFLRRAAKARRHAELLAAENRGLLEVTREQARTDSLTGLPNRRALSGDLELALRDVDYEDGLALALFDLDGFKQYNDTFGHPAGDALLARLGRRLATTLEGLGDGYRMGGDEFCVIASAGGDGGEATVRLAAAALSEEGEGFRVGCSYGVARLPVDAHTAEEALRIADQRMYGQKASGRASPSRETADVLVTALGERLTDLQDHTGKVARLAERTAQRLSLSEPEVQTVRLAAELHDIGKVAIPDAILTKPGPLDEDEWAFIRRHTVIGERIVLAAPSLADTASLVRASHERIDGAGYPDGLRGDEIPLGARIIAVCDAFDAMVSDRAYRAGMSAGEATAELRRCAGTQFDAEIVAVFVAVVEEDEPAVTTSAGG